MAKESKHATTSDVSRSLCDHLRDFLQQAEDTRRDSSPNYCGVHIRQRRDALYWVQHTKKHIWVYPGCDDTGTTESDIRNLLPPHVELRTRPFPPKGMGKRTPFIFKIETEEQVKSMGPLLRFLTEYRRDSTSSKLWLPFSESSSSNPESHEEGNRISVLVNKYERNRKNREACIRANGTCCKVCEFDFSSVYGSIGKDYIHVHHLTKLASLEGKARKIDPINDLQPVCPNCHEMLHRSDPPYSINQLKVFIANAKNAKQ